jgi:hypothetical protein
VRQSIELGNHQGRATSTNMHEQDNAQHPGFGGRRIAQRPALVDTRQRVGIATFMVATGKATPSSARGRSAS